MASDAAFFTKDQTPAKFWAYVGDGDWVAAAEKEPSVYTKARRLEVFLPIEQFPRDGIVIYLNADGKQEMRRVIEGAIT
jgi:hypothetical protein